VVLTSWIGPERHYSYLAGTRVPVLIVKSAGTLSTYRSGTYLQWAEMMIMNLSHLTGSENPGLQTSVFWNECAEGKQYNIW